MFCLSNFIISPRIIFPIKLKDNLPSPCYPWAFMKGQGLETGILGRASCGWGYRPSVRYWPNPCLRCSWEWKNPVTVTMGKGYLTIRKGYFAGLPITAPHQMVCALPSSWQPHRAAVRSIIPISQMRNEPELRHFGTVVCIHCFKDCCVCQASADSNHRSGT